MEWIVIENTNYEITNSGQIRHIITKKIKPQHISPNCQYYIVTFKINKKSKSFLVHRLVAKYFINNPENKEQVNHIDKNKLNNNFSNLEWVSPKENMKHHYENGGIKRNNQTYKNKFGKDHNRSIPIKCNDIIYYGISEASRKTGIGISTIYRALKDNRPCKGLYFEYI